MAANRSRPRDRPAPLRDTSGPSTSATDHSPATFQLIHPRPNTYWSEPVTTLATRAAHTNPTCGVRT